MPLLVLGCLALGGGLLAATLPETLGEKQAETIQVGGSGMGRQAVVHQLQQQRLPHLRAQPAPDPVPQALNATLALPTPASPAQHVIKTFPPAAQELNQLLSLRRKRSWRVALAGILRPAQAAALQPQRSTSLQGGEIYLPADARSV